MRLPLHIKQVLRLALIAGVLALVGVWAYQIGTWAHLKTHGYCQSQSRYLTDADFILIAMAHIKNDMDIGDADSLESYWHRHPECCAVYRLSPTEVLTRLWYSVEVEVNFKQPKPHYPPEPYYTQYVVLGACGEEQHMYGEGTRALKTLPPLSR